MDTNTQLIGFASSYLVSLLTNYLTKASWFPWMTPETKGIIRAFVLFVSAVIAIVAVKLTDKQIDGDQVKALVDTGATFFTLIAGSTFFHHWFLKKDEKSQGATTKPQE